jgi:DNA-binding CsgD family transcriptional regulator
MGSVIDRRSAARPVSGLLHRLTRSLSTVTSMDDAMEVLAETVAGIGYPHVLYTYLRVPRLPDGRWVPPPLITRNFPQDWDRQWNRHSANDPYYHNCFGGTLPFRWHDVQSREGLTQQERDSWNYLADLGIVRGHTVPLHLPGGSFAAVSAICKSSEAHWDDIIEQTKDDLLLITHRFHGVVHPRFTEPRPTSERLPALSPRECECLSWTAHGKTAKETAALLDLSVETVRVYLKRAIRKLDAANGAHAVARGFQLGLID